jgi:hypothetical protein
MLPTGNLRLGGRRSMSIVFAEAGRASVAPAARCCDQSDLGSNEPEPVPGEFLVGQLSSARSPAGYVGLEEDRAGGAFVVEWELSRSHP